MSRKLETASLLALVLALVIVPACRMRDQDTWEQDDASAQNYGCAIYREQGCAKMVIASGGELEAQSGATIDFQAGVTLGFDDATFNGTTTNTLGAADKVLIDGSTTAQTQTDGSLDVNMASITADTSALNVASTQNSGAATGTDQYGAIFTLTQNDADGDMRGLKIDAATTAVAAAGSYEYGLAYDCAVITATACSDGIVLTSSGVNLGMTDGLDVSDGNIAYGVNLGLNPILGYNADELTLGATDHHLIVTADEAATVTFMGADNSTPADTAFDTHGAGTVTMGSDDVTNVTVNSDVGLTFANNGDSINNLANSTFDFTVNTVSGVTLTASDTDAVAALTVVPGGAAALALGAAATTSIDVRGIAVDVDMTGGISIDADLASNFSTAAGDILIDAETGSIKIIGSEEAADSIHLDANDTITSGLDIDVGSVTGLTIDGGLVNIGGGTCGTAAGDNDLCVAADLEVDNTLDVDGDIDLDGTGFDADVSSAISLDAGATSNFNTSAGDVQLEAETGSVWIKADEEVADAIHLDANQTVTVGIDIDVGSVYGLSIDGGLTDFGSGTYSQAAGDGDVGIQDALEVNGVAYLDGGAECNGTLTLEQDATIVNSESGVITVTATTLALEADLSLESDATIVNSQADVITVTVGATGYLVVTTGNLVVGTPGTASLALNGNDAYVLGTLEADGLARLDGGATLGAGDLTISNGSFFPDFTDAVVSDGDTITPTAYTRSVSASGNITFTLAASCTDGQPLVIIADDNHSYIIAATNLRTTDGNALTLDQYDTVGFICRANEWWLLYESNNQ